MKNTLFQSPLPPELSEQEEKIRKIAIDLGCDFYDVFFEVVDSRKLNEIAAYEGFPVRYPHWRWGMTFNELDKTYVHGLSKIYELVINTNPCIAYLMRQNSMMHQKLVMAHVFGHAHFFKNNYWFKDTNKNMLNQMGSHAATIQRIQDKYGSEKVESFIDRCLTLNNLIDIYNPSKKKEKKEELDETMIEKEALLRKLNSKKSYMDSYINPKSFIDYQKEQIKKEIEENQKIPVKPEKDVLGFLIEHAPMKDWQRTVLSIIREEAYYFAPQGMTKILNEGFAVWIHNKIMLTSGVMESSELIEYARSMASILQQGRSLNPYKLGYDLIRDIEERWNKGRFGRDYEECEDELKKETWDTGAMKGTQKIFDIVRHSTDINFVGEFFTKDFCERNEYFATRTSDGNTYIDSREFEEIKKNIINSLSNGGNPIITVEDGNFRNRNELLLKHEREHEDLNIEKAIKTLENLHFIWNRPVHIETLINGELTLLSFDGKNHSERVAKEKSKI